MRLSGSCKAALQRDEQISYLPAHFGASIILYDEKAKDCCKPRNRCKPVTPADGIVTLTGAWESLVKGQS